MIKVSDSDGNTAAYYISPYPHWLGEEGLVAKVEALRAEMNREQLAAGLDPSSLDRSQRLHRALETKLVAHGYTIVEAVLPSLDRPYDPLRVS